MIRSVQLVFDCADPDRVMRFWGPALQYPDRFAYGGCGWAASDDQVRAFRERHPQFDGRGRIDDEDQWRVPIFIQRVPEPKRQPNRLRPELAVPPDRLAEEQRRLTALGAVASEAGGYRDAEGNEFTLVGDTDRPELGIRLRSIVIDCLEPARMVTFWSTALGSVVARQPGLSFNRVAEPKSIKNRLHLDLNSTDYRAEVDRLGDLGASVLYRRDDFVTLQDPEGNEFCIQ